jgi:hypothetical protein
VSILASLFDLTGSTPYGIGFCKGALPGAIVKNTKALNEIVQGD